MQRGSSRGTDQSLHVATCESSLGRLLVATSGAGIAAVLVGDDDVALRADLRRRFPAVRVLPADDATREAAAAVNVAITPGRAPAAVALPLDFRGTPFQREVWTALCEIPRGTTATYAEIAARIGRPSAVRAVARACAANVHAVLVPCHRVVRSDGGLSGYRWGVERKRALLREEGAAAG